MYIIENEAHEKISEHKNLSKVKRPDGGWSTNVKVGDPIHDEGGEVYFIQRVLEPVVGEGPRNLGWGPLEYVDGSWQREKRIGPALPPPQDPVPGDDLYNHRDLRKRDYDKNIPLGDQADAILKWATSIRMKQSAVADAVDGLTIEQLPDVVTPAAVEGDPDVVTPGAIQLTADSLNGLKSALDPVFDLPADLDGVIGQWTSVKAKFPKPEE